jgi:hypothetical protein
MKHKYQNQEINNDSCKLCSDFPNCPNSVFYTKIKSLALFSFVIMETERRALRLLGKGSTPRAMPPVLLLFLSLLLVYFSNRVTQ